MQSRQPRSAALLACLYRDPHPSFTWRIRLGHAALELHRPVVGHTRLNAHVEQRVLPVAFGYAGCDANVPSRFWKLGAFDNRK